mmetsp:Transcript_4833/g.3983  ORF Transcript_4833/g.3983 Transcript_4833/m.3983 type:complete len:98 (+) Transcript_4833:383-676(+)
MLGWRNRQTGQTTQLNKEDIASVSWYKVSKECMLKILMKNGDIYKYDGFQDSNYETVKAFFKKHYGSEHVQIVVASGQHNRDVQELADRRSTATGSS